jgi:hypothetical protein
MIQLRYALLADAANRTSLDRANVLGIFGSVNAEAFPLVMARCSMAVAFIGEAQDAGQPFRFEGGIWKPDGEVMSAIRGDFELTVGVTGWPEWLLTCDFEELTFAEPGIYSLRFRWGSEILPEEFGFTMPLPVILKTSPEKEASGDEGPGMAKWKEKLKDEWRSGKKWIRGR